MRKNFKISLAIVLLLVMSISSVVAAEPASNQGLTGDASIRLVLPFTEDVKSKVTREGIEKLISVGWIETLEGMVRVYPLKNVSIKVDNEIEVKTDALGSFYINNIETGLHTVTINDEIYEVDITKGRSNNFSFVETINFFTYMGDPDEELPINPSVEGNDTVSDNINQPYAEKNPYSGAFNGETVIQHNGHTDAVYRHNSYVTCNRFNNYKGDFVYYNKGAHPIDSAYNFVQSDCDIAIAYGAPCLNPTNGDYATDPSKRYCKSFASWPLSSSVCSQHIDHKSTYHAHSSLSGPSGY